MAKKKSSAKKSKPVAVPIRFEAPKKRGIKQRYANVVKWLDCKFTPVAELFARYYMALVFLKSGTLKFQSLVDGTWQNTVNLYTYVFPVPGLPPKLAAILGTGAEVILPIMLLFGFGTRIAAFGLLIMTLVIETTFEGLPIHHLWAIVLALLLARGPGKLSLDCAFKYEGCGACKK